MKNLFVESSWEVLCTTWVVGVCLKTFSELRRYYNAPSCTIDTQRAKYVCRQYTTRRTFATSFITVTSEPSKECTTYVDDIGASVEMKMTKKDWQNTRPFTCLSPLPSSLSSILTFRFHTKCTIEYWALLLLLYCEFYEQVHFPFYGASAEH